MLFPSKYILRLLGGCLRICGSMWVCELIERGHRLPLTVAAHQYHATYLNDTIPMVVCCSCYSHPIIDKSKFPDMRAMNDHAHSLGVRTGWYEHCTWHNPLYPIPTYDLFCLTLNCPRYVISMLCNLTSVKLVTFCVIRTSPLSILQHLPQAGYRSNASHDRDLNNTNTVLACGRWALLID